MKQETIDALREASDAAKQLQDQGVYHTSMHIPLLGVWRCANVVLAEYDADTSCEHAHAVAGVVVDGQPITGEQMGGCDVEQFETTPITSEPAAGNFNFDFDKIIEEEGGLSATLRWLARVDAEVGDESMAEGERHAQRFYLHVVNLAADEIERLTKEDTR